MGDEEKTIKALQTDHAALGKLFQEHRLLKETIECSPLAFAVYDDHDRLIAWNDVYERIHPDAGLLSDAKKDRAPITYEELVRSHLEKSVPPEELDAAVADRVRAQRRADGKPVQRHYTEEGWLNVTKYRTPSGAVAGFAQDINDLKQREAELENAEAEARKLLAESEQLADALQRANALAEERATTDLLTGLMNRRGFEQYVVNLASSGTVEGLTLIHADLDFFKQINDRLGHAAGDHILIHCADIFLRLVGAGGSVARIGGDEFMLLTRETEPETIERMARDAIRQISAPIMYGTATCCIGVSLGIACLPEGSLGSFSIEEMIANSDIALYRAKDAGRNRFRFFSTRMRVEHDSAMRIADQIAEAVESRAIRPYFQPQIDAQNWKVVGVEALARWDHPKLGTLSPADFLYTAERTNLVHLIDDVITARSLDAMVKWRGAGVKIPRVSVNMNAIQLGRHDIVDRIKIMTETRDLTPDDLAIEILESVVLDSLDSTQTNNLRRLETAGYSIHLDDFGTGHAALSTLMHFQLGGIKIDRSFIVQLPYDTRQRTIVSAIVGLARSLGVAPLAEGVETRDQLETLMSLGCTRFQGYLFARAMPEDEIASWLETFESRPGQMLEGLPGRSTG